jgi:transcriptional regulator with XRE-family HTH domain
MNSTESTELHEESTFARKLDHLFKTVRPASGGERSYAEVAAGLSRLGGPKVSANYIWQLRTGIRDNPSKRHIEALADYFGVPPTYFFDDDLAARVDAELDLVASLRDSGVREIALRSRGLSADSQRLLQAMIEQARKAEGLPDDD